MKFDILDHFYTGISIPVAALRSKDSCGIGEFHDLLLLGTWCKEIGLELIQILPINDTGFQNSPYSALSAFALHPIYLRIQQIPEFKSNQSFLKEFNHLKSAFDNKKHVDFYNLLTAKLNLLNKIYASAKKSILTDNSIKSWIKTNPWIESYAVYNLLKQKHHGQHWQQWKEMVNPDQKSINEFWNNNPESCVFFAWVQYHLEKQLIFVSDTLASTGIYLKGDIPIMMDEDSTDIWYNRQYFDINMHAGAPPDMFALDGQNWSFPVYNWDNLEKDEYTWWKSRLRQAAKFYHAYRIDHVLGFFRIWQIPTSDITGILGHFNPSHFITANELLAAGFDEARIRWLSFPHIHDWEIPLTDLQQKEHVKNKFLSRINNENLFNLNLQIIGEKYIHALKESQEIKKCLLAWYRDRTLIKIKNGLYHRLWSYPDTKAFKSLNFEEKIKLEHLFKESETKSENIWTKQGKKLLTMLQESTDMVMCAEDLGVVPACVPVVLKNLNILSLKIERWTKHYNKPDHPFIETTKYPRLSVCTPSVHDTTTIRGWWQEELTEKEKKQYFALLKLDEKCPELYNKTLARQIINRNLDSNSILAIFQMQDLLFLNEKLPQDIFSEDRINIPGTVSNSNWTYRIPITLEEIINDHDFTISLFKMIAKRKQRKVINN